jgi:AcrR family transcriptional regulator
MAVDTLAALGTTQEERIVDATLACISRWGVSKTSFEDVAREAGVSRATVYRLFPGGRDALLQSVVRTELSRFGDALETRIAEAATLEDLLVAGMVEAGTRLASHAALRTVLTYEPALVLTHLAFDRTASVFAAATALAKPHLSRFLTEHEAEIAAEWAARIVVSYASWASVDVDLTDEASVRRLVCTFMLPALSAGQN